ncbi:MAG: hypothetical protein AB7G75_33785 [Candidatus Binatia bacterium]
MSDLPQELRQHFLMAIVSSRAPAYLFVDKNGAITSWGGDLQRYGIDNPEPSIPVKKHADFLQGLLLPSYEEPTSLPCVITSPWVFADVYIFPSFAGFWILLLDATEEGQHHRFLQQQV